MLHYTMEYQSSNYQIIRIDQLHCVTSDEDAIFPIEKNFENSNKSTLILLSLRNKPNSEDQNYLTVLSEQLIKIRKKYDQIKIIILLDSSYRYLNTNLLDVDEVIFLNFHLYCSYVSIYVEKKSKISQKWNYNEKKFLFLTGKPNRSNRIRLFYKLVNAGLVNQDICIWSLFAPQTFDQTVSYVPELTGKCDEFFKTYAQSPDNSSVGDDNRVEGDYYDTQLFENTNFRVISETNSDNGFEFPIITEKTWLTIINSQPFILAGDINYIKRLQELGFKTFNEYLPIKDYDSIVDTDERWDAIVTNIKYWNNNILKFKSKIQSDVKYNQHKLCELAIDSIKTIEQLLKSHKIPLKFNEFIPTIRSDYKKIPSIIIINRSSKIKINEWYQTIRGENWPLWCNNTEEFNKLPKWIKKECIDKFGFDEEMYI